MKTTTQKLTPQLRFKEFDGEWEQKNLGDVTKYIKGFAFKSEDYKNEGVRIVRVSDLGVDRIKNNNGKLFIDEDKASEFDKYKLRTGNIVITTVGSKPEMLESAVGRGIYIHNDNEGLLNQNMLKFENVKDVSNGFIIGLINSKRYQHYMKGIARGNANQANITVVDLLQYNLNIPQLPEQQKIATFLTSVDTKIQQLTRKKQLLETYKKGAMQQLFSQKLRFKQNNGSEFPKWEEKRLGAEVVSYNKKSTFNDEFEVLTSSNKGLMLQSEYYGENRLTERDNLGFNVIPEKHITYRSRSDNRKFTFNINKLGITGVISTYYPVFISKNGSSNFIVELLNFNQNYIGKFSVGTSQTVLSFNELKRIKFKIPCSEEQQKIANYLSALDTKIESVQKQLSQTQTFKKGLLQQLFV
ncbi:type I restriction enzyme, S subunit [Lutibacter agarilyticus]|uniref:Type I restriction enzyme, S subunit n=1 Tax=Lutibacter agarilyticus TaxID=1109740 RepID=A0A238WWW0_9FLAO|nr:restriction endonuclease subunit S [Lutibacter agarilyticus]SNR50976.1 type I restriction enzyme, S subunit [Lutibacter agarilyticus]